MIKVNKRINKICSYVNSKIIADIGADHGYITKYLFENNLIDFAFVTDISLKCLNKSRVNLKHFNDKISYLVGDGLEVFNDELDAFLPANFPKILPKQVIIAGMGGMEIIKILSQDKEKIFSDFILQPQTNVIELRQFLTSSMFEIQQDVIAKEGKMFYNIIVVSRANKHFELTREELLFGKTNLKEKSKDFICYLNYEKNKCEQILKNKFVRDINERLLLIKKII